MGVDDRSADEPYRQRVDRLPALTDFEMEVRAGREAARADIADQLPSANKAAWLRDNFAHVAVDAGDAPAVGDLDLAAVAAAPAGTDHPAVARGNDRSSPAGADVDTGVEASEVQNRVIAVAEI